MKRKWASISSSVATLCAGLLTGQIGPVAAQDAVVNASDGDTAGSVAAREGLNATPPSSATLPSTLSGRDSATGIGKKQGVIAAPATRGVSPPGPFIIAPGIAATLSYTEESAGNPVGGIRQGTAYTGQVFLGVDFDLKTLANIDGGAVHTILTDRHGRNLAADYIGNNTSVQEVYGTLNFHLAQFTYEQKFLGGRADFEIGRTVANISFLASPLYCSFQSNSICGNPTFIFKNSNFTYFPASSWGSQFRYNFTDKVFFHVGAYEVNPQDKQSSDNGFNFSVDKATGATIPFELGYGTDFTNDRLPRHYGIGGYYDASSFSDPYLDSTNRPAVLSGLPYQTHFGRSGFYARFDQMLYRPNPDSPRGLSVFGVFMQNVSGRTQEDQFFAGGLLQTGTFAGRDQDTIGLLIDDQRFSQLFLNNIIAARTSVGGSAAIPRNQIMMELNYGYQFSSSVRITPNLQGIINPDQNAEPFRTKNIRDAFVIGCKATIDISTIANIAMGR